MARLVALLFIGCLLGLSIAQVQPVKFKLNQGRPNQKRGPPSPGGPPPAQGGATRGRQNDVKLDEKPRFGVPGPLGGRAGNDVKIDEKPRFASAVAAPPAGGMQPPSRKAPPAASRPIAPRRSNAVRPYQGPNAAAQPSRTAPAPAGRNSAPAAGPSSAGQNAAGAAQTPAGGAKAQPGRNAAPPAAGSPAPAVGSAAAPAGGSQAPAGKRAATGGSQATSGQNAGSSGTTAGSGNSASASNTAARAPAKPSLTPSEMVYYNKVLAALMQQYQPPSPLAQPLQPMTTTYAPYHLKPYGYCNHQYGNSHNCACEYQECSLIGEKFSAGSDGCGSDMHCCCDNQF